jgi:hypothetical protein
MLLQVFLIGEIVTPEITNAPVECEARGHIAGVASFRYPLAWGERLGLNLRKIGKFATMDVGHLFQCSVTFTDTVQQCDDARGHTGHQNVAAIKVHQGARAAMNA